MSNPLNPDALEAGRKAYRRAYYKAGDSLARCFEKGLSAYLAVAQPVVNSVEDVHRLESGTILIDDAGDPMTLCEDGEGGMYWACFDDKNQYTAEHVDLPARVLYRPEVES